MGDKMAGYSIIIVNTHRKNSKKQLLRDSDWTTEDWDPVWRTTGCGIFLFVNHDLLSKVSQILIKSCWLTGYHIMLLEFINQQVCWLTGYI